jgi:predicted O-methyltransferase YrrM
MIVWTGSNTTTVPHYSPDSTDLADVRGWLNDDEGRCLAKYAQGKRVLEVGSYCGRSTIWMARVAKSVTAVDTWAELAILRDFKSNIIRHGVADKICWVHTTLQKAASSWELEWFDFIFIDADHSFEAVTADIQTCIPLLSPGGLLALHDFQSYTEPGPTAAAYNLMAAGWEVVDRQDMVLVLKGPEQGA